MSGWLGCLHMFMLLHAAQADGAPASPLTFTSRGSCALQPPPCGQRASPQGVYSAAKRRTVASEPSLPCRPYLDVDVHADRYVEGTAQGIIDVRVAGRGGACQRTVALVRRSWWRQRWQRVAAAAAVGAAAGAAQGAGSGTHTAVDAQPRQRCWQRNARAGAAGAAGVHPQRCRRWWLRAACRRPAVYLRLNHKSSAGSSRRRSSSQACSSCQCCFSMHHAPAWRSAQPTHPAPAAW